MKQTFTLPFAPLKALLKLAGKLDIRCYLNGVAVQIDGVEVRMVATDGNTLGIYRHVLEATEAATAPISVIIPREVIESFKPGKCLYDVYLAIDTEPLGTRKGTIMQGENNARDFEFIDGRFPDWTRVVPQTCSGEVAQFDPSILARFQQVGKTLGTSEHIQVANNGGAGALVTIEKTPNFCGICMPWRADVAALPEWLAKPVVQEQIAEANAA